MCKANYLLALAVLMLSAALSAQAAERSKTRATANQPIENNPSAASDPRNPHAHFWNDPAFVKSFMGTYGIASEIEPKLSAEEQTLYQGLRPMLQEDPARAARELEGRVKPESSALLNFILGSVYFQTDQPARAIPQYETAVAKFPSFRRAHKNLGFALVQSGEFERALPHLTKTIELGGGDGSVFGLLGFAYLNLERHLAAETAYKNALLLAPDNPDWKLGLIKSQIATGHFQPAAELLDELLAKHPEREAFWALQAGLYLQMEQPIKAAVNYEMMRKLGKADAKTLMLLGDIYMSQEARDLALAAYLEGIQSDTEPSPIRAFRAAEILVSRGAWSEARALLDEMKRQPGELSEEDEHKRLKLEARIAHFNGETEEGVSILERVVQRNPLDGQALLMLGDFYARNGEREKADFRFELASKMQAYEAEALVKRAQLLVAVQKYAPAVEMLRRAQKINPRDHIQRYLEKVESVARTTGS